MEQEEKEKGKRGRKEKTQTIHENGSEKHRGIREANNNIAGLNDCFKN